MNDVTKLIERLENTATVDAGYLKGVWHTVEPALMNEALSVLRGLIPKNGIGDGEIPYKIIVELYNAAVQGTHLPPAKGLTPMRKRQIAQRWLEDKERQTIEWWTDFFRKIAASDFLAGRTPPTPGHENWRPNFDWFMKPGNLLKVAEGSYENKGPRSNIDRIERFR